MAFERWRSSREDDEWRKSRERAREDEERERRYARYDDDRPRWADEDPRELRARDSWAGREPERYRHRYDRPWGRSREERESREYEGNYAGRGPSRYTRSDSRIYEDVNDRLTEHPGIDATDIDVIVQNRVVVLKGCVRARDQKRMAEDVAEFTPGVQDVKNELRVGSPTAPAGIPLEEHSLSARESRERDEERLLPPRPVRDDAEREREEAREREELRLQGELDRTDEHRVRRGMTVLDSNGERVGEVKEGYGDVFHLDRPMRRDLYVPYDAIRELGDRHVTLRFHADELDRLNWDVPDLIGMGRRRH